MNRSVHSPMPSLFRSIRRHMVVLVLGLGSAVLILTNLRHSMLWADEAQTALLSRMVLEHGVPLGTDGRNFFSHEQGAEYGPAYVWRWHTWLPFYILAAFFGTFGESTFVARLPFALCGVATVLASYRLAESVWRERRAALAAGGLLALSVPFLILTRQCRYYSMGALFTVLVLLTYWQFMERHRFAGAGLIGALLLLFHTQYIYTVPVAAALVLHALLWHRNRLRALIVLLLAVGLLCLPWVMWLSTMQYSRQYGHKVFDLLRASRNLKAFLMQLDTHMLPWFVLEIPVILLVVHVCRGTAAKCFDPGLWRGLSLLLLAICANLALLALLAPETFFRYLAPIVPLVTVLGGRIVTAVGRWHWSLAVLLVCLLIGRGPLLDYAYELTHDFNGPVEGITSYLNAHAKERDVVAITYGDMPLKFYTRLRVVGGLTGEDLSAAEGADWIIIRHHVCSVYELPVRKTLNEQIKRYKYEPIGLHCPDTRWQNREDPADHLFRTVEREKRVIILQRIRTE